MPIQLLLNGYFRSGTTLLWELCRKGIPEDSLALYEPIHPDLPSYILDNYIVSSEDPLHGKKLWLDYQHIQQSRLMNMLDSRVNQGRNLDWSKEALFDYLDTFDALEKPVFLKTNRLHYELKDVSNRYGARVLHIIRNPISVFGSIRRTHLKNGSFFRRMSRLIGYPLLGNHAFETRGFCRKALLYAGTGDQSDCARGLFAAFARAWITANSFAIDEVNEIGGKIVVYEQFLQSPETIAEELTGYVGFPIRVDSADVNNKVVYSEGLGIRWRKLVKRLCLEKQMAAIKDIVCTSGVEWKGT